MNLQIYMQVCFFYTSRLSRPQKRGQRVWRMRSASAPRPGPSRASRKIASRAHTVRASHDLW